MAESAHRTDNPGEARVYPPPAPTLPVGDTKVNVDWHQVLASGFAPALRATTVEERAAAWMGLSGLLDELGYAAHLGPFEAEEEALGALLVGLLRYAQARNLSLWNATDRKLTELAIVEGTRLLAGRVAR